MSTNAKGTTSRRSAPASSRDWVVVFDIGNVLVDWDPRHLFRTIFRQDPAAMEWFLEHVCTPAWNLEQDGGRTWAAGVSALVVEKPEWRAEIELYDRRWHDMIPRVIEGSVLILEELRAAGVKLYAVTNFSSEKFIESRARFPFLGSFDGIIVSGDEKLLKPHAPIFFLLCTRYGLTASDCIFIDDNVDNVAGAAEAGMRSLLFASPDMLRADLRRLGLPLR